MYHNRLHTTVRHTGYTNGSVPSLTGVPPHVRIVSGIEVIWRGKGDLSDDVVFKMIEDLDSRGSLSAFNQNQTGIFSGSGIRS